MLDKIVLKFIVFILANVKNWYIRKKEGKTNVKHGYIYSQHFYLLILALHTLETINEELAQLVQCNEYAADKPFAEAAWQPVPVS